VESGIAHDLSKGYLQRLEGWPWAWSYVKCKLRERNWACSNQVDIGHDHVLSAGHVGVKGNTRIMDITTRQMELMGQT
jgi:hypothetical protein